MEEKISFGRYITKKRKELGITQKQLAEKLYITESAISKWERGLSYPDISLVAPICESLNITEHELITASDDYQYIKLEREAKGYRRIINTYSWVFYLAYGITLFVCLLCNIIIQHTLSWFFIVLTSLMVAFSLTNVPVLVKKNKGFWTLISFYVSLNILLLACCIYTGGTWFFTAFISILFGFALVFLPSILRIESLEPVVKNNKTLIYCTANSFLLILLLLISCTYTLGIGAFIQTALPISVFGLAFCWMLMVVIRYIKINAFFKTSICMFLSSAFMLTINSFISMIIDKTPFKFISFDFTIWDSNDYNNILNGNITMIIVLSFALLGVIFTIGGVVCSIKKRQL